MEEIAKLLSSPTWWFSVVLAGILINLLTVRLERFLESRYSAISKSLAEKNDKKKSERARRIRELSSSDSELYLALLNLNHLKLECIYEYLMAGVMLLFGMAIKESYPIIYTFIVITAMLAAYTGMRSTMRHGIESAVISEAKLEREQKA